MLDGEPRGAKHVSQYMSGDNHVYMSAFRTFSANPVLCKSGVIADLKRKQVNFLEVVGRCQKERKPC